MRISDNMVLDLLEICDVNQSLTIFSLVQESLEQGQIQF